MHLQTRRQVAPASFRKKMPSLTAMIVVGATVIAADPFNDARAQLIAAPAGEQWTSTFSDQFNSGSSDLSPFTYDLGGGGWGNDELEVYTDSSSNVSVSGGYLHINVIASGTGANETYTSGRILTSASFSQAYGLFEFRAKFPAGTGLWPAVWMLPANAPNSSQPLYGAWPASGEVDILETLGQETGLVQGSLHSGTTESEDNQTETFADSGKEPENFTTTAFHTYDLLWSIVSDPNVSGGEQAEFNWYVDGTLYETQWGGWDVPATAPANDPEAPFDQPFYFILNMAVGGTFGGTPDLDDGAYGMEVDYLEAFQATIPEPATGSVIGLFLAGFVLHRPARH
jgi:beta-glucanase (GH16 family)